MRHALVRLLVLLAAAGALAACDGGSSGPAVDCTWFADDNCWKASVRAAAACAEGGATAGTLSTDLRECTFPDGAVITFDTPVPLADGTAMESWTARFTLTKNGAQCLRLDEETRGVTLDTTLGTFHEAASSSDVSFTCPDGTAGHMGAMAALGCGFGSLPGILKTWSTTSVSVSLSGGDADGGQPWLFECQTP